MGRQDAALEAMARALPSVPEGATALNTSGLTQLDAAEHVVQAAATERVLMFNEAHHVPAHRAFLLSILPALRALGYSHLALEAVSHSDHELNTRGYPLVDLTGHHTNEPVFGELIRTGLRLGFKVLAYDDEGSCDDVAPEECASRRERVQAENIKRAALDAQPGAKVVVLSGFDHNAEVSLIPGWRPMAMHFKDITGIDPFTVDQVSFSQIAGSGHEGPTYRKVLAEFSPTAPVVLHRDGKPWPDLIRDHRFPQDLAIVHPRARMENGRPSWLWLLEGRKGVSVRAESCPEGECLVRAVPLAEAPNAVPADQLIIQAGGPPAWMLLPPGEHRVQVISLQKPHKVHSATVEAR